MTTGGSERQRSKGRWLRIAGIALAVLAVLVPIGLFLGYRALTAIIKAKVEGALGPRARIAALAVGTTGVEIRDLRIRAPKGLPKEDELRVDRIWIVPSFRSLLGDTVFVSTVEIERPYLMALRLPNGNLRPFMGAPAARGPVAKAVRIARVLVTDGTIEFYDAAVARPPLLTRLSPIRATFRDVRYPQAAPKTDIDVKADLQTEKSKGKVDLGGWLNVATLDGGLKPRLTGVDLSHFQPYMARVGDARIARGLLDMQADVKIAKRRLNAPGDLTISDLEFAPSAGIGQTFMGVPRNAVVSFLKDHEGKIHLNFTVEGSLDDPRFALQEAFASRLAVGLAETVGFSVLNIGKGTVEAGKKGAETIGGAAKGLGEGLQKLFK